MGVGPGSPEGSIRFGKNLRRAGIWGANSVGLEDARGVSVERKVGR